MPAKRLLMPFPDEGCLPILMGSWVLLAAGVFRGSCIDLL